MKKGLAGCRSAEQIQSDRYVSGVQPSRTQGAFCAAAVLPAKFGDDASQSKVADNTKTQGEFRCYFTICSHLDI